MTKTDDGGLNQSALNGYDYAELVIEEANRQLSLNADPLLKEANPNIVYYPIPEIPIRFVLAGVYFHKSTAMQNANQSSWPLFNTSCINCTTEINIFDTPLGASGIANSYTGNPHLITKVKMYNTYTNKPFWEFREMGGRLINHEVGHLMSLRHDWSNADQCIDTPVNNACWNDNELTNVSPPSCTPACCDNMPTQEVSNNIMGYNRYRPGALTYEQIERINNEMSVAKNQDYILACDVCPDWCSEEAPAYPFFEIDKTVYQHWNTNNMIIYGQGSFNEDIYEIEICKVGNFNTTNQTCLTTPQIYNTGIQNGVIGTINLSNQYNFNINSTYKITLRVDNFNCPMQNSYSKIIRVNRSPKPHCKIKSTNQNGLKAAIEFDIYKANEYDINIISITNPSMPFYVVHNKFYDEAVHTEKFSLYNINTGIYRIKIEPVVVDDDFGNCSSRFIIKK